MRRLTPLLALACACSHSHRQKLADGSPAFVEARTEHFRLVSDLPQDEARAAVAELENRRARSICG